MHADDMQGPLEALWWHWGEAYIIVHPEPDFWLAERRDTHRTVRAETPEELRDAILADYLASPVSRDVTL
jgi:hypothetical protein